MVAVVRPSIQGVAAPVAGSTLQTFDVPAANGKPPRVVTSRVPSARGTMLVGTGSVTGPPTAGKSGLGWAAKRVRTCDRPVDAETDEIVFIPASTT